MPDRPKGPHPLGTLILGVLLALIGWQMLDQGVAYVGRVQTVFGFIFAWGAVVCGAIVAAGGLLGVGWTVVAAMRAVAGGRPDRWPPRHGDRGI